MPLIIGLGGTTRPGSSTECSLAIALDQARRDGAATRLFDGAFLSHLPYYGTPQAQASDAAQEYIAALGEADGLVIASPGYHGTISGLVKNAIDYIEERVRDPRRYLDGRAVGLIATAFGWQATGSTLSTLRSIVHALRGWPTPFGVTIRTAPALFSDGSCADPAVEAQFRLMAGQVVDFARSRRLVPVAAA